MQVGDDEELFLRPVECACTVGQERYTGDRNLGRIGGDCEAPVSLGAWESLGTNIVRGPVIAREKGM